MTTAPDEKKVKRMLFLYSHLDTLARGYELADTMGFMEKWQQDYNSAREEVDRLHESLTEEEYTLVYDYSL